MAQRNKNWLRSPAAEDCQLNFVLLGAGAAAMTVSDDAAKCLSPTTPVTYNGTGDYTLNFKDGWKGLRSFDATIQQATPTASNSFALKAVTNGSATTGATIRFQHYQGGAAADLASSDKMYFDIVWRDGVI